MKQHRIAVMILVLFYTFLMAENEALPVQIKSNPSGASVYIDSFLVGKTNLGIFLPAGRYKMRISKEGYLDGLKEFTINERSYNNFNINLREKKCFLVFHQSVANGKNKIMINGVDYQEMQVTEISPAKYKIKLSPYIKLYGIELNPGAYEVEISHPNYYTNKQTINLNWGDFYYFDKSLIEIVGRLQLAISPLETQCRLFKNAHVIEEWTGMTDLDDLPIGEYRLKCKCPGYLPENITVNIEENKITRLNIQLKEGPEVITDLEEKRKTLNEAEYEIYRDSIYTETFSLIYKKAQDEENYAAQYHLGYCFDKGIGTEEDVKQAAIYYQWSAMHGNSAAQNNWASFYKNGRGVEQDYENAIYYYKMSAKNGYAAAQTNLANCYINGEGVEKDFKKAVEWYYKAAEQGNSYAQNYLGICYQNGLGVNKNYKKAVEWFQKAADQGNAFAQFNLGECLKNGKGIKKDLKKAAEWFKKSADQGNLKAEEALKACKNN